MANPYFDDLDPDQLADRIDKHLTGYSSEDEQEVDARVKIAVQLSNASVPNISTEMLNRVHKKVLAAHQQQQSKKRRSKYYAANVILRVAAVLVVAIFISSMTLVPTLANSVPGELLYSAKRSIEQLEITFASSEADLINTHLVHAERRLSEEQSLIERQTFNIQLLSDAQASLEQAKEISKISNSQTSETHVHVRTSHILRLLYATVQQAEQRGLLSNEDIQQVVSILPPNQPSLSSEESVYTVLKPTATYTTAASTVVTLQPNSTELPINPATTVSPTLPATLTVAPSLVPTVTTHLIAIVPTVATFTPTPTDSLEQITVIQFVNQNTNVRKSPSTQSEIITVLRAGSQVEVIQGTNNPDWEQVKLEDGRLGWVAKFLLSDTPPPTLRPTMGNETTQSHNSSNQEGDFGCEHQGDYCNVPTAVGNGDANPGQNSQDGNGNHGGMGNAPAEPPSAGGNPPTNPQDGNGNAPADPPGSSGNPPSDAGNGPADPPGNSGGDRP